MMLCLINIYFEKQDNQTQSFLKDNKKGLCNHIAWTTSSFFAFLLLQNTTVCNNNSLNWLISAVSFAFFNFFHDIHAYFYVRIFLKSIYWNAKLQSLIYLQLLCQILHVFHLTRTLQLSWWKIVNLTI